ncbi:probable UDP-N-acetylglucosamine 2-epimerase [Hydra vulgaris]|uniref:UDP-N-acetylglucosamine 2-epimerase (non-hydrolyzing) n=1 Tax=Hydra vulgaris TaxID=6087 RepID=A0ABM4B920_HYDVU
MKKILIVFGTRPEAIKMAPLVKEFEKHQDRFDTRVCLTAQHRQMLDQVINIFDIKADYDLNIMQAGQDLYDITARVLLGMRDVLADFKPDVVLVHGDTSTSTAAALAAFYKQIPVGHVEAGLRTNNIYSPWPEEMNRQLTGRITTFHFAPTPWSKNNLLTENVNEAAITVTGNTVIDALHLTIAKIDSKAEVKEGIVARLKQDLHDFEHIINDQKIILVTGHRRENFGDGFINICEGIKETALKHPEASIIYPVHLNPNVQEPVNALLKGISNVYLIAPLDYLPFVYLMSRSYLVLTDSGGVQEEAPGLGKPVIVMRNTTERPEAVEAGTVKLVGTDKAKIFSEISALLSDKKYYLSMSRANTPYGDGKACGRIIEVLSR